MYHQPTKSPLGYIMVSDQMHHYLFPGEPREQLSGIQQALIRRELSQFDMTLPNLELPEGIDLPEMPPMSGGVVSHIDAIAASKWGPLRDQLLEFLKGGIPNPPGVVLRQPRWTRYDSGGASRVAHPLEPLLVLDTETFVKFENYPVMAAAVSESAWYIWLHPAVVSGQPKFVPELIELGYGHLLIGHNPKFDSAHFQETYHLLPDEPNYWLDTMSMHIATCGMSSKQREAYTRWLAGNAPYATSWATETSRNNLVDVYNHHVRPLQKLSSSDKATRDIFVVATSPQEFYERLDELVEYNLKDVRLTYELAQYLVPRYLKSQPSLVTFGAHLGLNRALLPIDPEWNQWRQRTEKVYLQTKRELAQSLTKLAQDLIARFVGGDLTDEQIEAHPHFSKMDWARAKTGASKGLPAWWRKAKAKGITPKSLLAPYLLEMAWDGHPLFHERRYGWVFEVSKGYPLSFESEGRYLCKVPHPKGDKENCGSPLSKSYIAQLENGKLSSSNPKAVGFLKVAKSIAYWTSARKRVLSYRAHPTLDLPGQSIEPMLYAHGTASRRCVEALWLTVSRAKPDIIGSELKSRVQAPEGFTLVGADFDAQEMKLAAAYADAYGSLVYGSSPMSYTQMLGDKSTKTDAHSLLATFLSIDRDIAKGLNFQMLYLSGIGGCATTIKTNRADLPEEVCGDIAKRALKLRRGTKRAIHKNAYIYTGGTDSAAYNFMLALADTGSMPGHVSHLRQPGVPRTPALKSAMSRAITQQVCGSDYLTSRANWGIQSSGVDLLHLFVVTLDWLFEYYQVRGRWIWSVHDENWALVTKEDAKLAGWCFQLAHLLAWAYFFRQLGYTDLPWAYQWFSGINVDSHLRKEVRESLVTPSNAANPEPGYMIDIGDYAGVTL